jgi:hypothetical protein
MRDRRDLILKGIWEAVPEPQNIARAFDVQQGKEDPAELLDRLKEQRRKYSELKVEDFLGQAC